MHFKEKFEWFLKNRMKEENADKASLSWKNRRSQRGTGWDFPTCCMRFFYKLHACVQSLSCVQLSTAPWTVAHQAPLSMEFFRQEYWSGLPLLIKFFLLFCLHPNFLFSSLMTWCVLSSGRLYFCSFLSVGTCSGLYFLGVSLTIAKELKQVHRSLGSTACIMSVCLSLDT